MRWHGAELHLRTCTAATMSASLMGIYQLVHIARDALYAQEGPEAPDVEGHSPDHVLLSGRAAEDAAHDLCGAPSGLLGTLDALLMAVHPV